MKKRDKNQPSAQEIANIAGVSLTLVHRKLAQGKTARQIISEAVEREQNVALRRLPTTPVSATNGHAGNGVLSFAAAQAEKENWLCELRKLEVMRERGELIPTSYVRLWATRFSVEGRDILLAGPGELQDVLAAESDPLKIAEILRRWVDRAMERYFQLETLWGGGEPLDEDVLRERFEAARLAVVKRR